TVSVVADHTLLRAGDTARMTFIFSEAVAGFGLGDVTVHGGTLGSLIHVGLNGLGQDIYTAFFTPDVTDHLSADLSVVGASYA
ncbi:Ig-like domain-containing protein, partial [Escherichia coli]|nr:Ig-like domain-containing protein [Escherichia coli]